MERKMQYIWESTISHRIGGRGCPYCAHKKVIKGVNDLMTMNPKIANEWNYNKNEESPDTVFNTSNKKFGGYVQKDMSIKLKFLTEQHLAGDAQHVIKKDIHLFLNKLYIIMLETFFLML